MRTQPPDSPDGFSFLSEIGFGNTRYYEKTEPHDILIQVITIIQNRRLKKREVNLDFLDIGEK